MMMMMVVVMMMKMMKKTKKKKKKKKMLQVSRLRQVDLVMYRGCQIPEQLRRYLIANL